jgi:hypothetical protein
MGRGGRLGAAGPSSVRLGGCPTPTTRQASGGGPPLSSSTKIETSSSGIVAAQVSTEPSGRRSSLGRQLSYRGPRPMWTPDTRELPNRDHVCREETWAADSTRLPAAVGGVGPRHTANVAQLSPGGTGQLTDPDGRQWTVTRRRLDVRVVRRLLRRADIPVLLGEGGGFRLRWVASSERPATWEQVRNCYAGRSATPEQLRHPVRGLRVHRGQRRPTAVPRTVVLAATGKITWLEKAQCVVRRASVPASDPSPRLAIVVPVRMRKTSHNARDVIHRMPARGLLHMKRFGTPSWVARCGMSVRS